MIPVGVFLVVAACAGFGLLRIRRLKREMLCIRGLIRAADLMRSELDLRLCPTAELLTFAEERTEGEAQAFFHRLGASMDELGQTAFAGLWSRCAELTLRSLPEDLRQEWGVLGGCLGRYELPEQLCALARFREAAAERLNEQTKHYPEQCRLSLTLGAAFGVMLCLLLT